MSRIGSKIKEARLKSNMTEKQLAKKIGVSEKFIKEVESGKKVINESVMGKISKVLGKDLNDVTMSFETEVYEEEKVQNTNKKTVEKINDVWNDALGSVLKPVPVYGYDMARIIEMRKLPIIGNRVEGHAKDKVLFLKVEDDDMIGSRIAKGDVAFGYITHEIENNALCLVEYKGERHIRQIKRLDSNKLLLISNGNSLRTETVTVRDIRVLVRLEKIEIKL
ncbi:XRE family transcriptional regulator [Clostridium botulinum]|uniref:DNA-binding protein n=1 Tax=Clostridium botulinum TaxID=1491 RepID=A0A9Q1UWU6_CLOBO|nr:XRE family transcriptional regulator [Clostridium botulinum]AEB77051.1 Predicted transcriptional regulator, lacI/xre family [Clostridium botulinum BKT015925]KEI00583.1 DNA-binding protein [Clostridium botulinum D str. 16868]KEI05835.1 DNA-binding protein [Clostridium botulinum C/D str. Sp77]KLU75465.1 DNA-binding protein [Clostridium botulinum V891]KOA73904.1 DNA-binding protein [Clostridium botulinum]